MIPTSSMNTAMAKDWRILLGVLLIFALPRFCQAEDWTVNKKVYHNVRVIKVNPDTVSVFFQDGGGTFHLSDLTPELQARFKAAAADAKAFAVIEKQAETDPIAHLVVKLSYTDGMWTSGGWEGIGLTKAASPEEVASKLLSEYKITSHYKIIRVERVPIVDDFRPGHKSDFTEILVHTASTDTILVVTYEGEGWSGRVYDAN